MAASLYLVRTHAGGIRARSTNIRVVDLENGVRAGDCITGFDYCDYSFDFLQDAVVALSIHKNWLGIFSESEALHRQEIHILNLHPWTDGEPVLVLIFFPTHSVFFSPSFVRLRPRTFSTHA